MHPKSASLTVKAQGGLLRDLITECGVAPAFDQSIALPLSGPPGLTKFRALWDTGATGCVITQAVVDACSLKATGMTIAHGMNSSGECETYLVSLTLPNLITFPAVKVIKGKLPPSSPEVLIGMDVITMGDFSITNKGGTTLFSFRIPSESSIDYVEEHQRYLRQITVNQHGHGPRPGKAGKHRRHK
jgi:hypothetical protein